jgi:hypothetical protein
VPTTANKPNGKANGHTDDIPCMFCRKNARRNPTCDFCQQCWGEYQKIGVRPKPKDVLSTPRAERPLCRTCKSSPAKEGSQFCAACYKKLPPSTKSVTKIAQSQSARTAVRSPRWRARKSVNTACTTVRPNSKKKHRSNSPKTACTDGAATSPANWTGRYLRRTPSCSAWLPGTGVLGYKRLRLTSNDPIETAPTTLTWASRISASGQSR